MKEFFSSAFASRIKELDTAENDCADDLAIAVEEPTGMKFSLEEGALRVWYEMNHARRNCDLDTSVPFKDLMPYLRPESRLRNAFSAAAK